MSMSMLKLFDCEVISRDIFIWINKIEEEEKIQCCPNNNEGADTQRIPVSLLKTLSIGGGALVHAVNDVSYISFNGIKSL